MLNSQAIKFTNIHENKMLVNIREFTVTWAEIVCGYYISSFADGRLIHGDNMQFSVFSCVPKQ